MPRNDEYIKTAEAKMQAAWTGPGSSPFIVDLPLPDELRTRSEEIARTTPLFLLFSRAPTLATWAVLIPLARAYGLSSTEVYAHIGAFVGEDLSAGPGREDFKGRYRRAARRIGLPVSGNQPTDLFFAPLGPPQARHGELAHAFVAAALRLGPPATEDTAATRAWQRAATRDRFPGQTRLHATLAFDTSAWLAQRFEAWRRAAPPLSDTEASLFAAYERVLATYGARRDRITGPPRLLWTGETLAFESEPSRDPQALTFGAFPTPLAGGQPRALPKPWPSAVDWTCGTRRDTLLAAPAEGEILVFDADTGALEARVGPASGRIDVVPERVVIVAAEAFDTPTWSAAFPAPDPSFFVGWAAAGEMLAFSERADLVLVPTRTASLRLSGRTIGRAGTQPLYGADADLHVRIDPELGGRSRIVRARRGDDVRFASVDADARGEAVIPLRAFRLDETGDPSPALFEVLAPSAAGDLDARAELVTGGWVWPGVPAPERELSDVTVPSNFVLARSAGLEVVGGRLFPDPRADVDRPFLGLREGGTVREFTLSARVEKLWHVRVAREDRIVVPAGARLVLGYENRHDTLRLRSDDRDADLLVLGTVLRRPFHERREIEIGAERLQAPSTRDDRIALRRTDGRVHLLARIRRQTDPSRLEVETDANGTTFRVTPQEEVDAIALRIESVDGTVETGMAAFGHRPVARPLPPGVTLRSHDPDTGALEIVISRPADAVPARAAVLVRAADEEAFEPLRDARDISIAFGLPGAAPPPTRDVLARLAAFLADPVPEPLEAQIAESLGPAYAAAIKSLAGESRMVGPILPALAAVRLDGGPPRHDIVGVAPWVLEAPPTALAGLPVETGLAPLGRIGALPDPGGLPNPAGEAPLVAWLERIAADPKLPEGLDAEALRTAFRNLRLRLAETDLSCLSGDGATATNARLIADVFVENLDALREFDRAGGGDPYPARIVALLERVARAAAQGCTAETLDAIAARTGLLRADIGRTLTLLLRAGIEAFAHFLALWRAARAAQTDRAENATREVP